MRLDVKDVISFCHNRGISIEIRGDETVAVDGYSSLNSIKEHKVTWVKCWTEENISKVQELCGVIVVAPPNEEIKLPEGSCLIICETPKMCFFELLDHFFTQEPVHEISETAVIETRAIGANCLIGHYTVIGPEVEIGTNVTIGNHVTIQGMVTIGDNAIIHSGCIIGKPGYGYYTGLDGHMKKVPHFGGVIIGHDVEIGGNTVIDCGAMDDTVIGAYTKINNLVHIAHNDIIGNDVCLAAGAIICGSIQIGERSYIAPGAVIKNQLSLGDNSFVGMQSAVTRDVAEGVSVFGVPAGEYNRKYVI